MKKYIYLSTILILFTGSAFAITASDLKEPKKPAYRLGVTYSIEKEYKVTDLTQTSQEKTASYAKEYIKNSTYADSS